MLCADFWPNMTTISTKNWRKPHNASCYQNTLGNENLLLYKCKISCFQSFHIKSIGSRGFYVMCWLLTKYDKVQIKNWWKLHNPKSYQSTLCYEKLQLVYKCMISCFQSFQLKSILTLGFYIMCWLLTKYY